MLVNANHASSNWVQEESDGNQSDHSEPMPAAMTELAAPNVITISDDEQDDGLPEPDDRDERKQPTVVPTLPKQRVAYALRLADLPPNLERFMKDTKSFFTRPNSLELRVLCEYCSFYIIC